MVKKRANGEGTMYRRSNGTWSAQCTIWTPTGKKRKIVSGRTQAEVNQKLTKAKADRDGGLVFDDENLRLGDYLKRWLEECVRNKVSASTYERSRLLYMSPCMRLLYCMGRFSLSLPLAKRIFNRIRT